MDYIKRIIDSELKEKIRNIWSGTNKRSYLPQVPEIFGNNEK